MKRCFVPGVSGDDVAINLDRNLLGLDFQVNQQVFYRYFINNFSGFTINLNLHSDRLSWADSRARKPVDTPQRDRVDTE